MPGKQRRKNREKSLHHHKSRNSGRKYLFNFPAPSGSLSQALSRKSLEQQTAWVRVYQCAVRGCRRLTARAYAMHLCLCRPPRRYLLLHGRGRG